MLDSISIFLCSSPLCLQQVDIGTMNAFNNEALKLGLMGSTILVSSGESSHTLLFLSRGGGGGLLVAITVVMWSIASLPFLLPPPHHYEERQIRCSLSQQLCN
jgi:hypothetical protein